MASRPLSSELLKLGIDLDKDTIKKYMCQVRRCSNQNWATFLRNHAHEVWACDFTVVHDLLFCPLYIFVVIAHKTRQIVHFAVTRHPTDAWLAQQLRQARTLQKFDHKPIKPNRAEKLTLAVLSANLKKQTKRPAKQFRHVIRIFQPETVFGWHRQLVKRKWAHARKNKVGRPPTADEVKKLVIQLALENNWGYGKISGELEKLGITLSETAVGNILKAEGIEPAPVRAGSIGWKTLMRH